MLFDHTGGMGGWVLQRFGCVRHFEFVDDFSGFSCVKNKELKIPKSKLSQMSQIMSKELNVPNN